MCLYRLLHTCNCGRYIYIYPVERFYGYAHKRTGWEGERVEWGRSHPSIYRALQLAGKSANFRFTVWLKSCHTFKMPQKKSKKNFRIQHCTFLDFAISYVYASVCNKIKLGDFGTVGQINKYPLKTLASTPKVMQNEHRDLISCNLVSLSVTIVINTLLSFFGTLYANALIILAYCRNLRLRTIQIFIFFFKGLSVTVLVLQRNAGSC